MSELTSFALANGMQVTVETSADGGGVTPASRHAAVTRAGQTLKQALEPVTSAAAEVIESFREHTSRPDEIEIAFGVRLDGSIGAIIGSASVGSHLEVTLRWSAGNTSHPS